MCRIPPSRLFGPLCAVLFLVATAPLFAAPLTFTDGGVISGPSGQISVGQSGMMTITTAAGDTFNLTLAMVVGKNGQFWNGNYLNDKKVTVNIAKKETAYTANIVHPTLAAPIPVRYCVSLTPEGAARVAVHFDSDQPITNSLSLAGIFFEIARASAVGSHITVNGVDVPVTTGTPSEHATPLADVKEPKDIVFFNDDPYRTVSVHIVQAGMVQTRDENLHNRPATIGMRLFPIDNQIVFDVTLPDKVKPASQETYAGLDFYAIEKLHVPQYRLSRNLIQNPSFEEGFQYWNFGNLGKDAGNRFPDNYVIDDTQSRSGHKSLKIFGEKGESPAMLSSFAIPTEAGKDYTFSFYAKAEHPGAAVTICLFPSSFSNGVKYKTFLLETDWKRFHYAFKAPSGALSMEFGIDNPSEDIVANLDDVQLEEGPLTDFTRKPIEMALVTDRRDNLFKPGEPMHARWEISGAPGARGKLDVILRDLTGAALSKHTTPFTVAADGTATVTEPWADAAPRGIYVQEANAAMADGFAVREFGRLVIAPPADPTVKHHILFANGGTQNRIGSWERFISHLAYFGIGSSMNFDPVPHGDLALMAKYHVVDVTSIFDSGDHFGDINLKNGWSGTDADLPTIEEAAYEKAKAYPEITYWKLVNEPGGNLTTDADAMKHWIVALSAAYRGLKRANPSAHVISIDPSNMAPNGGIAMLDNFLANGGGAISDLAAIHPYRTRPEEPDMDSDLDQFEKMLDNHAFKGDIWFTEGGGHLAVHNPILGPDVHKALSAEGNGSSWRIGLFSYDIGDGERYAAAYAMRAWLVGLKYGDRVKQQVDWYYGSGTIDYNGVAETRALAVNTLSDLLGNADFVQDVPLSEDARCYLFKDPQNRPIAAIWTHDLKHEIASLPPSLLHMGRQMSGVHVYNMVGSEMAPARNGDLAVSPFPIFLRGAPGTSEKLAAAIGAGFESSSIGAVTGYAQVKDAGHVGIELRNTLSKTVKGALRFAAPGQAPISTNLSVLPGKTGEIIAPFVTVKSGIQGEDAMITWTPDGGGPSSSFPARVESLTCPRVASPLPLNGDLAAWKAAGANVFAAPQHMVSFKPYPANPKYPGEIPWKGPKDLSARFGIAYTQGMLYLAFDVNDDTFSPAPSMNAAWLGDSVQIYFDPWATGHSLLKRGADDDDSELDVWPGGDGVSVYRAVAPAIQVAFTKRGVVSAVRSSLTKKAGGYVVQLAIPEAELAPLTLKAGRVFNMSFIINDNDGDFRKRGLTLTPNGAEPFQHPELYPTVVLGP